MSRSRFLAFLTFFMSLWAGIFYYAGSRLVAPSGLSGPGARAAWTLIAILTFIGPLTLFSGRIRPKPSWYPKVQEFGFACMGFMTLLVPLLLFRDLALILFYGGVQLLSRLGLSLDWSRIPDPDAVVQVSSRGLPLLSALLWTLGYRAARRRPPVSVSVDVPLENLPAEFDGFKLAQISDVHVGSSLMNREAMEILVQAVNAAKPDLVALTGDLADGYASEWSKEAAPLSGLKAPEGLFFVSGNHEYYWDPEGSFRVVKELGFTQLQNEHRLIRRGAASLVLAGIPDPTSRDPRPDPAAALSGSPSGLVRILLAHQPQSYRGALKAGFHLQLSGHTHGGQYWPFTWLIHFFQPIALGLHRIGGLWVYVNRGSGFWGPPLRLGRPAEITILTLRRAP